MARYPFFSALIRVYSPPKGAYKASHSWFEARILRSSQRQMVPLTNTVLSADTLNQHLSRIEVLNPNPECERERGWLIQKNVQASSVPRIHVCIWDREGLLNPEEEAQVELKGRGQGLGEGFVESLREGDRVAIVARAQVSLFCFLFSFLWF